MNPIVLRRSKKCAPAGDGATFPRSVERVADQPISPPPPRGNRDRPSVHPPAHLVQKWEREKQGDAA